MTKSFVWKYFSKESSDKAKCYTCLKVISNTGGTTTSMKNHILLHLNKNTKLKVLEIYKNTLIEEDTTITKLAVDSNGKSGLISHEKTKTIEDYYKPAFNETIARFAAQDGFSFSQITKSSATKGFLKSLNYECPTSKTTVRKCVLSFYEDCVEKLKNEFSIFKSENHKFSIVLDEWTCVSSKRYLNVSVFCNKNIYNLGLMKIVGSANADNIYGSTKKVLDTFGIDIEKDVISITTDGVNVMKSAFRNRVYFHQLCYNHAIHLCVVGLLYKKNDKKCENEICISEDVEESEDFCLNDCFDNNDAEDEFVLTNDSFNKVIEKIRVIVKKFKNSPLKQELLQKYVMGDLNKSYKVILDVKTRWNSLFYMCDRYMLLSNSISKALVELGETNIDLTENEKVVCANIIEILEPLESFVQLLSKSTATMYQVFLRFKILLSEFECSNCFLSPMFEHELRVRYEEREINVLFLITIYLNDYSWFETYAEQNDFTKTLQNVRSEIENIYYCFATKDDLDLQNNDSLATATVSLSSTPTVKKFKDHFNEAYKLKNKRHETSTKSFLDEFIQYENKGIIGKRLEIVLKWLKNIKPTSTDSERVFSIAGNIKTKLRNKLQDNTLNALVFLKSWFNKQQ